MQLSILKQPEARLGLVSNLLLAAIASIVAIGILAYLAVSIRPDASSEAAPANLVRVYCAAGVAQPIKQLADSFNRRSDHQIKISRIGGSGELAGQIKLESETELRNSAGMFISNDELLVAQLSNQGIFESQIGLATQKPVIAVAKDFDLKLTGIPAMIRRGKLRFGVASKRAAVGALARTIAAEHEVLVDLERTKVLDAENVMVLANALATNSLDAAIIWDSTVVQLNEASNQEILKIAGPADPADQTTSNVSVGIVAAAKKQLPGAKAFTEFLRTKQFGGRLFKRFGLEPIEQTSSNPGR